MINYDYIIYGAGPTGLTLAYLLAKNNFKVCLVEKDKILGGCWKVEWQDKYFSEHSPRVLLKDNSGFFKLLKNINFNISHETLPTYGNTTTTNYKLFNFFFKNLTFSDYFKLFQGFIFQINNKNLTVTEWLNKFNFSTKFKKAFSAFSILLANTPDKLLVSEIFNDSSFPIQFLQFKNNQKWINLLEIELVKLKVTILKNYTLEIINQENNNIISTVITQFNRNKVLIGKNHIITFPPHTLVKLLLSQNNIIKNNWDVNLTKWLNDSVYYSFGFQLHFKQNKYQNPKLDYHNYNWCFSCLNKYNLIILPISDYQTVFSKDETIQTVWSCTIVDTQKINHMTKKQIINDVLNILNLNPDYITFSSDLRKEYGKWISKDSAFSLGKSGIFPVKGKINNLFAVGPHNSKGITTINKAVNNAINFIEMQKLKTFNLSKKYNSNIIFIIIVIIIIVINKLIKK